MFVLTLVMIRFKKVMGIFPLKLDRKTFSTKLIKNNQQTLNKIKVLR